MRDRAMVTCIVQIRCPVHTVRVSACARPYVSELGVPTLGVNAVSGQTAFASVSEHNAPRGRGFVISQRRFLFTSSIAGHPISNQGRSASHATRTHGRRLGPARQGRRAPTSLGVRLRPRSETRARPTSHGGQLRPLGTLRRGRVIPPHVTPGLLSSRSSQRINSNPTPCRWRIFCV